MGRSRECSVNRPPQCDSSHDARCFSDRSCIPNIRFRGVNGYAGYPLWYKILGVTCIANFLVIIGARFFISPSVPQKQVGQRNEAHQQINGSPGARQIGNVLGSMTVNQMHAGEPETLARLRSEVHRLLRFPDAILDKSTPPSLLEGMLANRLPY